MKDYIYLTVILLLIFFAGTLYLSEKSGTTKQKNEISALRFKLDSLLNDNTKADTIYQKDTTYIVRFKIKQAKDSTIYIDTSDFVFYTKTYTDTLRTDEVDIWWDVQTEGELAFMNWGYKLHVPLIIREPGTVETKILEIEKKRYNLYLTYDAGLMKSANQVGLHLTTKDKIGFGYKYDFSNNNHLIRLSYKLF